MNKIIKMTFACVGAMALTACSDWLDTKSDSIQDEEQVFTSLEQTQLAVKGVYADLCSDAYIQLMTIHQGAGTDVELIDGIGATATGQNNERDGMNYNASTSWAKLGTLWELQYSTIEDCNRIISNVKTEGFSEDVAAEMLKCVDEARVIRAMVYLDLIRVFGDVPMMWDKAKSDLSNVNVGKTDRDVILDAMIADLKTVVDANRLPWCGQGVTSERINMGYAKGLYANILMTRAGYSIREDNNDKAEAGGYSTQKKLAAGYQKFDNITGKDTYSDDVFQTLRPSDEKCKELYTEARKQLLEIKGKGVHDMNPSFADEWAKINKLELDQTYYENMFEIPVGFGNAGELGYTVGVRMNGTTVDWGNYNSSGKLKTTAVMLYSYQPTDTRRDITCVDFEIKDFDRSATTAKMEKPQGLTTIDSRLSNKPFGLYIGKWDVRKMSDRWKLQNKSASSKFGYGINTVRMRYPQILLWLAECENQLDNPVEAKNLISLVHKRAFNDAKDCYTGRTVAEDLNEFDASLAAASSKEEILNLIDQENKLEFCGENFRKWDLIRWNRLHQNIWKAKQKYFELKDGGIFVQKIFYKYLDENEKYIDWSSATWYGESGTNTKKGGDITISADGKTNYAWLASMGYLTSNKDNNPGRGLDFKGLNGDSYSGTVFGTDYGNLDSEMPTICSGLVGSQKINASTTKCTDEGVKVKNRYLMPIYSNVVNSSIGSDKLPRVYNSYGY